MGNQGQVEGNSEICIGIQSQLILPEFIYLLSSLRVQRSHTLNLECKEVRDQFLENLEIPIHFL